MCQPRRIFIETLIEESFNGNFDEAMNEWIWIGKIFSLEVNFKDHCDLCGAAIYKVNYVIFNVKTKSRLQIGSECVKRFTSNHSRFKDAHPVYVHKQRKNHQQKQLKLKLIGQYNLICNQGFPEESLFIKFRANLIKLLQSYKKLSWLKSRKGAIQILTKVLKKSDYIDLEIKRIQMLLDEPQKARKIYIRVPRANNRKVDKYGILIDA